MRNISNELTIGTNITLSSAGLQEYAKEQGWWDGNAPFSFKDAYSHDPGTFTNEDCEENRKSEDHDKKK